MQGCFSKCQIALHALTVVAIIALIAACIRCGILAIFTVEHFNHNLSSITAKISRTSHAFDLMHSFIQSIHVVEYLALLYGIGGYYLFTIIKKKKYYKLNSIFEETYRHLLCTCSCTCLGVLMLCGIGLFFLTLSTFVPVVILTYWTKDILSANITSPKLINVSLNEIYVVISYFSHTCHSTTRVFMVCITVVIRSAWLNSQTQLRSRKNNSNRSLLACAKMILRPKWLEQDIEVGSKDTLDPKERFTLHVNNYNTTGQLVAPLYSIFQQWFIMQWVVYFIKIIEDLSIAIHSLVTENFVDTSQDQHELFFVLTHLVFDLILFLVPYFFASLYNQYHNKYHDELQRLQNRTLIPSTCIL